MNNDNSSTSNEEQVNTDEDSPTPAFTDLYSQQQSRRHHLRARRFRRANIFDAVQGRLGIYDFENQPDIDSENSKSENENIENVAGPREVLYFRLKRANREARKKEKLQKKEEDSDGTGDLDNMPSGQGDKWLGDEYGTDDFEDFAAKYDEYYDSLPGDLELPDSDMLKSIHAYVSDFYSTLPSSNEKGVTFSSKKLLESRFRRMDGTALLAMGVLLEEMAVHALGPTGHLALLESRKMQKEHTNSIWTGVRHVQSRLPHVRLPKPVDASGNESMDTHDTGTGVETNSSDDGDDVFNSDDSDMDEVFTSSDEEVIKHPETTMVNDDTTNSSDETMSEVCTEDFLSDNSHRSLDDTSSEDGSNKDNRLSPLVMHGKQRRGNFTEDWILDQAAA